MNTVVVANYPQLSILAWNLHQQQLPEDEVFALYERNWRFMEVDRLSHEESQLLDYLIKKYGNGVLNV